MIPDMFGAVDLLGKGLSAAQLRQDVITNNIANVDTPGFKASSVEFESYMKEALDQESGFVARTSSPKHIQFGDAADASDVEPSVIQDNETSMRMDGNNVDIDSEMSELAKTNIYYSTLVSKLNGELERLRLAIDGR